MMPRIYRLLALGLALFWVPSTAHCQIEALGIDFVSCADDCHGDAKGGETRDGCDVVENGLYKTGDQTVRISPVIAAICRCLICVPAPGLIATSGPGIPTAHSERPRDWVPTWQFVQRAALSPRAPSSV